MFPDYLLPIIYLVVGLIFGEISLRVKPITKKETSAGRGLGYILAVLTWPLIVVIAIMREGDVK